MKFVSRLFIAVVAALTVLLAIANRGRIVVSLDPLPFEIEGPLYAILLIAAIMGVIAGGTAGWAASLKWRRISRRQSREIASLEQRLKSAPPLAGKVAQTPGKTITPDDPGPDDLGVGPGRVVERAR